MVNEAGQYYHCFGCKASGDAIKFLERYENIAFYEAVQMLADMANMPMPTIDSKTAEQIQQKKAERQQILAVLRSAAQYYYKNLYASHPNAEQARRYLDKRGITKESIVRFGIGCSLDFEGLIRHLKTQGYSVALMQKAGLVANGEKGFYDSYGKRLMFPLIDTNGEVVGFSGRLLEDKELAKYKNTTQTPVFNKSEVVFAINLLKKLRDQERKTTQSFGGFENIIIVEGQIDVISMHQHGFTNTVACLGTAITPQHIRKLKQFSDNIILMLDGDSAGQKAALRSIDTLRAGGVSVKVVTLPEGLDPDEFLKKYGTDKMKELLTTGEEGMDYKFRVLASKYNLSSNYEQSKFVHEALLVVKTLSNEAEQDIYLKIIHKYTGISVEVLRGDLQKIDISAKPFYERDDDQEVNQVVKKPLDAYTRADMYVLASIIYQKPYATLDNFDELHFDDCLLPLCEYVKQSLKDGKEITLSGVYSYLDVDNSGDEIRATVNFVFTPDDAPDLTYKSCLLKNKQKYLNIKKQECEAKMESDIPIEQKNECMSTYLEYVNQISKINQQLQQIALEYVRRSEELKKQKETRREEK